MTFHVESAAGAALGEERFDSGLGHHLNALISSILRESRDFYHKKDLIGTASTLLA